MCALSEVLKIQERCELVSGMSDFSDNFTDWVELTVRFLTKNGPTKIKRFRKCAKM